MLQGDASREQIVQAIGEAAQPYVEGHYFKGARDEAEFTVSLSDEEGNEDLPVLVWVQVAANLDADGALDDAASRVVRERLLTAGFRVARMVNFGRRDEQRIDYS